MVATFTGIDDARLSNVFSLLGTGVGMEGWQVEISTGFETSETCSVLVSLIPSTEVCGCVACSKLLSFSSKLELNNVRFVAHDTSRYKPVIVSDNAETYDIALFWN